MCLKSRTINKTGLALLKQFEGLRLTVYKDLTGIPTVGYGHVTELPIGTVITPEEALSLLKSDVEKFEQGVDKLVSSPISDNQFSALVCFAFNVGLVNFEKSTLLKQLNIGKYDAAALEFPKWDKAGGKSVSGLLKRRLAEQALFRA